MADGILLALGQLALNPERLELTLSLSQAGRVEYLIGEVAIGTRVQPAAAI
jgi:hypothetical protein